jgi:hypothetical protein
MNRLSKSKIPCKALFLLAVYFLHFAFFQYFAVHLSDPHSAVVKIFFNEGNNDKNTNSDIATVRTLDKHENPQYTTKVCCDFSTNILMPVIVELLNSRRISPLPYFPASFHFSEACYKVYLRDCVFRI